MPRKEENRYKNFPEGFFIFNDSILNIPGIKHKNNGYINDANKLIIESLIRWICVLIYIPRKHVM